MPRFPRTFLNSALKVLHSGNPLGLVTRLAWWPELQDNREPWTPVLSLCWALLTWLAVGWDSRGKASQQPPGLGTPAAFGVKPGP